jgi:hypothetical protein
VITRAAFAQLVTVQLAYLFHERYVGEADATRYTMAMARSSGLEEQWIAFDKQRRPQEWHVPNA